MFHQTNIMVGDAVKHVKQGIVEGMYAYSKLLRMGNYWVITILNIEDAVNELFDVRPLAPHRDNCDMYEMVVDFPLLR